ncbi:MAG TPA: hypothetical protein VGS19_08015 [Streptosporangiaceae bacterium]|nr:hypothetical protein [Streptosporangiaceae bacterium]
MRNVLGRASVAFGAVALAAGLVATSSVAASAATHVTHVAKPGVEKVAVRMRVVRIDAAVARAHGYVVRTDSHGREYTVKAGSKSGPTPNDTLYGNCGWSWMWEWGVGNRAATVETGFHVYTPAVAYYWQYWMEDNGGESSHTFAGGLAFRTDWGTINTWPGLTPGPAYAWVQTTSDAILDNGDVCSSAGPDDSTTIY